MNPYPRLLYCAHGKPNVVTKSTERGVAVIEDEDDGMWRNTHASQIEISGTSREKTNLRSDMMERIRQRAYQLYEKRGGIDGFALDDWLNAEREILGAQEQRKARAAKGSRC